jgi:trans-aconitate methyltransferase
MAGFGTGQIWRARRYAAECGFVSELGQPVVALLAPRPGERILDLGCGDGALTERLVAAGASVVAVDASADMVAAARARGLDARVVNGEELAFRAEFDAVFSNAALHWMRRPDRVIAGVAGALKPGGRFVGEMGGFGNVATLRIAIAAILARRGIDAAALDPWYFPTAAEYRARLAAHGFAVHAIELFPRPTVLPGDIAAWLDNFAGSFLAVLPAGERPKAVDEIRDLLAPALRDPEGVWVTDYVRLRFAASLGD